MPEDLTTLQATSALSGLTTPEHRETEPFPQINLQKDRHPFAKLYLIDAGAAARQPGTAVPASTSRTEAEATVSLWRRRNNKAETYVETNFAC